MKWDNEVGMGEVFRIVVFVLCNGADQLYGVEQGIWVEINFFKKKFQVFGLMEVIFLRIVLVFIFKGFRYSFQQFSFFKYRVIIFFLGLWKGLFFFNQIYRKEIEFFILRLKLSLG